MKKPLFSLLYFISLVTAALTMHQAFADRGPAVEPMTEISIEENKPTAQGGYNFHSPEQTDLNSAKRIPANITNKSTDHTSPYSYIGPILFLFALPVALWIVVSKKMKAAENSGGKVEYYPNTHQFKPFKTDYQRSVAEDDEDYPKAS